MRKTINKMTDERKLISDVWKEVEDGFQQLKTYLKEHIGHITKYVDIQCKSIHQSKPEKVEHVNKLKNELFGELRNSVKLIYSEKIQDFKTEFSQISNQKVLEFEKPLWSLTDQSVNLDAVLNNYYCEKVEINEECMEIATKKFTIFKDQLDEYLQTKWKHFPTGKLVLSGSVADKTKVCLPNEFDLMLPLILPFDDIVYHRPLPHLLKVEIKMKRSQSYTDKMSNEWLNMIEFESYTPYNATPAVTGYYVSPRAVSDKMKEIVSSFFTDESVVTNLKEHGIFMEFARSEHYYKFGPAIDILVVYDGPNGKGSFVVDIVPYIQDLSESEKSHAVINPYYTNFVFAGGAKGGHYVENFANPTIYWRRSHSSLETHLFQSMNDKIRKPLMIWKALALHNTSFIKAPILNSFHLKNIVMLLAFDELEDLALLWNNCRNGAHEPSIDKQMKKWALYPLALQIKEIGKKMYTFLRKGTTPWAFHKKLNIAFKSSNEEVCKNHDVDKMRLRLADYLEEIIAADDWEKLINEATLEVKMNECPFSHVKAPGTDVRHIKETSSIKAHSSMN